VHDPVDQLQGLGGPLVDDHHCYVRPLGRCDTGDVRERGLSGDDIVAQLRHREGDFVQANPWPIGNQDPEAGVLSASIACRNLRTMLHQSRCIQAAKGVHCTVPDPRSRFEQFRTPTHGH
jgi:hypothetical protein